jgi:glutamyl-Q tRNA(Asp) synthetase
MSSRNASSEAPKSSAGLGHPYRGRFAPSPTGPLHLGSLSTALISWLDARANKGQWFLRIEDLDPPRESIAAADSFLYDLDKLGLYWDGPIVYQSQRHEAYTFAIKSLIDQGAVYWCSCSRQDLLNYKGIYPGTCRSEKRNKTGRMALRCSIQQDKWHFKDLLLGPQDQKLSELCGDFVIMRKDGLSAYQLAVVVDDAWQNITHILRGRDLLSSTSRQLQLQQLLGYPTPYYAHLPLVLGEDGQKLSKQNRALPLNTSKPSEPLIKVLTLLKMPPPLALHGAPTEEILTWALKKWSMRCLKGHSILS